MTTNHINSYPSVYAIGHKAIERIFYDGVPVLIEEKVDGSQFSMCRIDGVLHCRSKGKELMVSAPEKMFTKAVEVADSLPLTDGWVYRCEYLQSPKHNTLEYSRTPKNHLIIFDVAIGLESYLEYDDKAAEAERLGLEVVPRLHYGKIESFESLASLMDRESILGGCKIEGFVVKNYNLFTPDKKIAVGKFVSEEFKEKHGTEWSSKNPSPADFIQVLTSNLRTEARWNKAIQHLREAGTLEGLPRDIGALIKEVQADIEKEEAAFISEQLYRHFWPHIRRGVTAGLPEFYKKKLAENAFQVAVERTAQHEINATSGGEVGIAQKSE